MRTRYIHITAPPLPVHVLVATQRTTYQRLLARIPVSHGAPSCSASCRGPVRQRRTRAVPPFEPSSAWLACPPACASVASGVALSVRLALLPVRECQERCQ